MGYPAGRRRKPQCPAGVYLVLDRLDCHLAEGHAGLHEHDTEDGDIVRWRLAEP